ncbi:hypothetical protein ACFO9Q_00150 [Paenibacillus sp. GCM10023252]|uniref:hypothetical protein n=1 Tax=Paenibacillus sp. GCM10023252 TaxID=3252649 RepID=UPI00360651ED
MTTNIRLSLYERGIVDALVARYNYNPGAARQLVVKYVAVVRKLGSYDNVTEHADRLVQAENALISPEDWLQRICMIDRESAKDKGIPHLERGTSYVQLS